MKRRVVIPGRLRSILYPWIFLYVLISILVLGGITFNSVRKHLYNQKIDALHETTLLIRNVLASSDSESLKETTASLAGDTSYRITVINDQGMVISDSLLNPAAMGNHADREEIAQALRGEPHVSMRFSETLGYDMIYYAVPVTLSAGSMVLRTSLPAAELKESLRDVYIAFSIGGIVFLAVALGITFLLISYIERPMAVLAKQSARLAKLDFSERITPHSSIREVQIVANSLQSMANELKDQLVSISHQRDELQAVLDSMSEAVIVIDEQMTIIEANPSANQYFTPPGGQLAGLPLTAVVKHATLHDLISETMQDSGRRSATITVRNSSYHVNVTTVRAAAENTQVMLVFNDITALMHLERIRKDFVANVSHELKTPITSIQGFSETLLDGALDNSHLARRFVKIINRQTERLQSIIDDLLILSELEQKQSREHFNSRVLVEPVIHDSLLICREKSQQLDRDIRVTCDPALAVKGNTHLIEQAFINLIDNAMKYSDSTSPITIACTSDEHGTAISVSDQGYGIPKKDLNRIFERFYRVEKARSREKGGTGLGLSIVKHIMLQHQGSVDVVSREGEGATFILRFPA